MMMKCILGASTLLLLNTLACGRGDREPETQYTTPATGAYQDPADPAWGTEPMPPAQPETTEPMPSEPGTGVPESGTMQSPDMDSPGMDSAPGTGQTPGMDRSPGMGTDSAPLTGGAGGRAGTGSAGTGGAR